MTDINPDLVNNFITNTKFSENNVDLLVNTMFEDYLNYYDIMIKNNIIVNYHNTNHFYDFMFRCSDRPLTLPYSEKTVAEHFNKVWLKLKDHCVLSEVLKDGSYIRHVSKVYFEPKSLWVRFSTRQW